jgi:hypothetical protein
MSECPRELFGLLLAISSKMESKQKVANTALAFKILPTLVLMTANKLEHPDKLLQPA